MREIRLIFIGRGNNIVVYKKQVDGLVLAIVDIVAGILKVVADQ